MMFPEITAQIKERIGSFKRMPSVSSLDTGVLISVAVVLVITILSYEATDLFYKVVRFPLTRHTAVIKNHHESFVRNNRQHQQLQDYDIITERNLFLTTLRTAGGSESADGPFDTDQKSMDFDLKGTIAISSSSGFIIVEERGSKKQKLYRLGDKIGARKLAKITRNTAVLKNGEEEITVKIKETVEDNLLSPAPGSRRNPSPSRNPALSRLGIDGNAKYLQSIMNQAVVRPFMSRGVRQGYIISNIKPSSLYEKAGLQNGDIIVGINNNPLHNANDVMQVLNAMQSGSRLELTVKRRGRTETINYTLE
jgi:general secretion pathway protein C